MKNEYIYERKGKTGISLQIKVPYKDGSRRLFKSVSINVSDYQTKTVAYEAARLKRDQIIMDIRNNRVYKTTPTVGELYEEYWRMSPASINTKQQYDLSYKYVMKQLEDRKIDQIEASDIQTILSTYAADHSQQMVKKAKYIWHIVFVAAQLKGLDVSDKTVRLMPIVSKKPARKNKPDRIVTFREFVTFTTAMISTYDPQKKIDTDIWYMLWIMYYTGCRPAEVLALSSGDLDFDNKLVRIEKQIGSTKTAMRQIVATKRPASFRHLPMTDGLETLLRDLISYSQSNPLLLCQDGLPYLTNDIDQRINHYKKLTGIQFNAYQLRHKFSDDMFANKVNPVVVRDLMGHSSSTMSLEYAKATPEQMIDAVLNNERPR